MAYQTSNLPIFFHCYTFIQNYLTTSMPLHKVLVQYICKFSSRVCIPGVLTYMCVCLCMYMDMCQWHVFLWYILGYRMISTTYRVLHSLRICLSLTEITVLFGDTRNVLTFVVNALYNWLCNCVKLHFSRRCCIQHCRMGTHTSTFGEFVRFI